MKIINIKSTVNAPITLRALLNQYIQDPSNPESNFQLGLHYDNIGQTASATSYYLRTAERAQDDLLKYECLLRASMCYDKQGARNFTVKGLLQHAISVCPNRPEAYYLMSVFYEKQTTAGHWNDCYMIASIGEKVADSNSPSLRTYVNYPGGYGITFQKAVSSWWCGLCDESRNLLLQLKDNPEVQEPFRQCVINNLGRLG
jgi:tetratricopeptide (TPR) repeat protein